MPGTLRRPALSILSALLVGTSLTAATLAVTATPASAAPADIRINEVESNGGTPGDWVELLNTGATPVDVSGFGPQGQRRHARAYAIPAGTTSPPGAYLCSRRPRSASASAPPTRPAVRTRRHDARRHATRGPRTRRRPTAAAPTAPARSRRPRADQGRGERLHRRRVSDRDQRGRVQRRHAGRLGRAYQHRHRARSTCPAAVFKDNDDTHVLHVPAGTTLAPGGYLVLEEAAFGFGLGGADSARLFAARRHDAGRLVRWTAHATTTYGRCPNGTGAFATTTGSTKGAANDCTAAGRERADQRGRVERRHARRLGRADQQRRHARRRLAAALSRTTTTPHAYAIPAGTTIAAGGVPGARGGGVRLRARRGGLGAAVRARRHDAGRLATPGRRTPPPRTAAARTAPALRHDRRHQGRGNACAGDDPASPWPGGAAVAPPTRRRLRRQHERPDLPGSGTARPACSGPSRTARARCTAWSGTARSGRPTPRTAGARARRCATPTAPATRTPRA